MIGKNFENNNIIKNNKPNSKNDTANNSPQLTKREDLNNNGFLYIDKKNKLLKNCYILKKNKK